MSDQNEAVIQELLKVILAGKSTTLDHLPKFARDTALMGTIKAVLKDKNAKFDIESGLLRLVTHEGANVFGDDHRQWNPEKLVDYALEKNNLTAERSLSNNPSTSIATMAPESKQSMKKQSVLSSIINKSLADLENAQKRSMI